MAVFFYSSLKFIYILYYEKRWIRLSWIEGGMRGVVGDMYNQYGTQLYTLYTPGINYLQANNKFSNNRSFLYTSGRRYTQMEKVKGSFFFYSF